MNQPLKGFIQAAEPRMGPRPVPDVLAGTLDPSPVFDLRIGLDGVPDGYAAMDAREALKVLVTV